MEWLADKLTRYIVQKEHICKEKYAIYRYGMLTGLETLSCMAICVIISIALNAFCELLVLFMVFFSLRAYVGGIHLTHFIACLVCSCSIVFFLLFASQHWKIPVKLAIVITVIGLLAIKLFAPLATKEMVCDQESVLFFYKQRNKVLLGIFVCDVIFVLLKLEVLWSLILYAILVVLISILLEIGRQELQKQ